MSKKMPARTSLTLTILLTAALAGCETEKDIDTASMEACSAPVSNAGEDVFANLGDAVTLDASLSEWCSRTSSSLVFTWAFIQTPVDSAVDETSLSDNRTNTAISPVFTPDVVGDYVLSLALADDNGDSDEDIFVVSVTAGDEAPFADCGGPYTGEVGGIVTLDGSNSYDPENADLEYEWTLTGPECSALTSEDIYNESGASPSFVPDCSGTYAVNLVASDGEQWSEPVICLVEVGSENNTPIADAGEGGELGACSNNPIELNGFGSYDLDGDELEYEWSVVSVPSDSGASDKSFSSRSAADATFNWDVSGTYVLQLQVSDGIEWSSPDVLSFTIADLEDNLVPVSNAGADQEVLVEVDCESSSYVWACPDCEEYLIELDGSGSYDPEGDPISYEWSESTETLEFLNEYASITTATVPPQAAEYRVDNTIQFQIDLDVADCEQSATDSMIVTYTCHGKKP
jgi:hypothetical protein